MPDGKWKIKWKIWYKDEAAGSVTILAESADLKSWTVHKDPAIGGQAHEGAKAFRFQGWYWLLTDEWRGMRVYRSKDTVAWEKQGLILDMPGERPEDSPTGARRCGCARR